MNGPGRLCARPVLAFGLVFAAVVAQAQSFDEQKLVKLRTTYRNSLVFLKTNKITETGAVVTETGTGFVVSKKGHILTSCHTVERLLRDELGEPTHTKVDTVEVAGATASRAGQLEPIEFLRCDPVPTDIALLKFKNSGVTRTPMIVGDARPLEGFEPVASMGFPLDLEFFVRSGHLGGGAEDDTFAADMTLNFGDSGAPVVNSDLQVIGLVIGGKGHGTRIGVVRPITYASVFLAYAGVNLAPTVLAAESASSAAVPAGVAPPGIAPAVVAPAIAAPATAAPAAPAPGPTAPTPAAAAAAPVPVAPAAAVPAAVAPAPVATPAPIAAGAAPAIAPPSPTVGFPGVNAGVAMSRSVHAATEDDARIVVSHPFARAIEPQIIQVPSPTISAPLRVQQIRVAERVQNVPVVERIPARPGYRITKATFTVKALRRAEVRNIEIIENGNAAVAVIYLNPDSERVWLDGIFQTVEERLPVGAVN